MVTACFFLLVIFPPLTWYYVAYSVLNTNLIIFFEASSMSGEGQLLNVYDRRDVPLHEMIALRQVLKDYIQMDHCRSDDVIL